MRPETAQGIFVNFKDLHYYNGSKLPFAAAQIGQAFRNEISPRQGLLRVREFTLAEIEHFVDPEDKSHPKYSEVANLDFLMFPREEQVSGQSANIFSLGEAVSGEKSGVPLVAQERFPEPREVEKLVIAPVKKELGLAFKGNQKMVGEALEHSFYPRPSKAGTEQLNVFRFPPIVAPIKCSVFPTVQDRKYNEIANSISRSLTAAGISRKIDVTGNTIGKRYVRTDELGVSFAITVDPHLNTRIR
ncbi:hypothetical protein RJ640_011763 [Escallonia rubra]|uniref:Aminoacyl-transfer RNA synthetases class-II family profile domain-containing protein n=1 Tax=Escallonia rubra TaxID=112253 RepID=A0AA88R1R6_9ASTE|nr:hypothetical protein RJ640_011763 [Escallonia rubra]